MLLANTTKDYMLWRRIRKVSVILLCISSLCFLFILSYYVTSNSSSVSCDPSGLLKQLITSVNDKNVNKIASLTQISNNTNSTDSLNKLTNAIKSSEFDDIKDSGSQIVVQTSDYVIYNTTFNIRNNSSDTFKKTVPIMYVKVDDKWFIDPESIITLLDK